MKATDTFYYKQPEPQQSCFLALRELITGHDMFIGETVKYGMPCFTYKDKPLCYLWKDKKTAEPYVLFVDGQLMNHPALESGDRAKMKILRVNPSRDLKIDSILSILKEAILLKG